LPEYPAEILCSAAAACGFPAFGVRVEPKDWDMARAQDLRRQADGEGLVILDAEVLWIRPGPFDDDLLRLVDLAVAMQARNLLAVSSDPDDGATRDKLARLCDHAAAGGIPVSLEFGRFTEVHDMAAARSILDALDHPNAGLLIDPLHLSRSGGDVAEVAAVPRRLFHYAQFCDAGPVRPAAEDFAAIREEALDGRLLPGDGALPLAALLDALPAELPLSVELRSRALREAFPDPVDRAGHLLERTLSWFERAA
jgi:sugar phosphate isomerase/epimerase